MYYYKITNGDSFIGIGTTLSLRKYQVKHGCLLICEEPEAQYIQVGQDFYHSMWMRPETIKGMFPTVTVTEITEEEYNALYDAVENGEDIPVFEQKEEVVEEPVIEVITEVDAATLAYLKSKKIALSKTMQAEYLDTHPLTSAAHGGKVGTYSITEDKQVMMMSQYMSYQIEKMVNPAAHLTWNEKGKSCEEWTEEEFLQQILEIKAYVYPRVTKQQAIEMQINDAENLADVNAVVIDYEI